jgi:hypothetical protein
MAKKSKGSLLVGPLYTPPGKSLGAAEVEGHKAVSVPDPLNFNKAKGK